MATFNSMAKKLTVENIIYCTYFDRGFLLKGLALHESLIRHSPNARLWVLAFDKYTENLLKKMVGAGPADANAIKDADEEFAQYGKVLNDCLSGHKFLTGNTVTLADFSIASSIAKSKEALMPVSGFSNIHAWYERVSSLDAWKKSEPKMS